MSHYKGFQNAIMTSWMSRLGWVMGRQKLDNEDGHNGHCVGYLVSTWMWRQEIRSKEPSVEDGYVVLPNTGLESSHSMVLTEAVYISPGFVFFWCHSID